MLGVEIRHTRLSFYMKKWVCSSDNAAHFFSECCTVGPTEEYGKQAMYDAYRTFCGEWGVHALGQGKFNTRLKALHPKVTEDKRGIRKWKGINYTNQEFLL